MYNIFKCLRKTLKSTITFFILLFVVILLLLLQLLLLSDHFGLTKMKIKNNYNKSKYRDKYISLA